MSVATTGTIQFFHSSIDEWVVEASCTDARLNGTGELESYVHQSKAWDRPVSGRELANVKQLQYPERIQISLVRLAKWRD